MEKFFAPSRRYILAGASDNPTKFGYRIAKWYLDRRLPVTLLNPRRVQVLAQPTFATVQDALTDITNSATPNNKKPEKVEISMSFVTPPAVSKQIVMEALKTCRASDGQVAIKAMWFQPGTFDDTVLKAAGDDVESVIAHGDCILVQGDGFLNHTRL
ncbi:hypothetical protein NADFUDRAFT_46816 [Nadsonia fulvescens var. elongata DSM 6958]|uniref:CoA-binding domain-containing protein n=1 Tax=Nadsonia fulvescens var. elongata DSM 6958 TaxID=857566 RepID=A0A1E3PHZ5_9ASCO|nr:hypothetical protein NADFUDRAFT_46816 [Nadsonia fulvescens var. elongata DSM 6958]